jgi:Ni,Fe-hydrogenase III large subunit
MKGAFNPQASPQHEAMTGQWLDEFLDELRNSDISFEAGATGTLAPARLIHIPREEWGHSAQTASLKGYRWAGVWAEDRGDALRLTACLEKRGHYLLLRTAVPAEAPELPSQTSYYPAADRPERHTQDLFGVHFTGRVDTRRWLRHQAWREDQYPLHKSFPVAGTPPGETPPDLHYPFLRAHGKSVYEIPVGPVHAGIIEPGHFRFQAVGETVLNLEERLGYVHKGIEKIAEGRDADGLARLAGRVSGDSTVAHAWAACMAMERAADVNVPPRASVLRAFFAERERIVNHLWDIAGVCNDVAFTFAYQQFGRLRELWLRSNSRWFGHRLLMDCVVPGGVAKDMPAEAASELREEAASLRGELEELWPILENNGSLQDRLVTAGVLAPPIALALGCLGYVGRASGVDYDLRRDAPYAPYDELRVSAPCFTQGDVAARVKVRVEEIRVSIDLLEQLLGNLPRGELRAPWTQPAAGAEGLGLVESWRGEILCFVRFAGNGRIDRYYPRDPSVMNWPALEKLILNNIVPDFPVCNKSVNGSYSGHDL